MSSIKSFNHVVHLFPKLFIYMAQQLHHRMAGHLTLVGTGTCMVHTTSEHPEVAAMVKWFAVMRHHVASHTSFHVPVTGCGEEAEGRDMNQIQWALACNPQLRRWEYHKLQLPSTADILPLYVPAHLLQLKTKMTYSQTCCM